MHNSQSQEKNKWKLFWIIFWEVEQKSHIWKVIVWLLFTEAQIWKTHDNHVGILNLQTFSRVIRRRPKQLNSKMPLPETNSLGSFNK